MEEYGDSSYDQFRENIVNNVLKVVDEMAFWNEEGNFRCGICEKVFEGDNVDEHNKEFHPNYYSDLRLPTVDLPTLPSV